jgi:hypothetical protein
MSISGDMNVYVGVLKERCLHLKKSAIFGSYSGSNFFMFVYSYISLSEPLSLLWEP